MKKYAVILLITVLAGCKTKQPVIQVPVKTVERKVTTLVPVFIPGDSAVLQAFFECDSLNNVLLKGLAETKGNNMESDFSFKDGNLNYKAKSQPDTVYLPSDTIYLDKKVPITVEVVKTEYRMSKLQTVFYYIGLITAIAIAVWLILKLKLFK